MKIGRPFSVIFVSAVMVLAVGFIIVTTDRRVNREEAWIRAILAGDTASIGTLITQGIDVNRPIEYEIGDRTHVSFPILEVSKRGDGPSLDALLVASASTDKLDEFNQDAVMLLVLSKNAKALERMLKEEVSLSHRNTAGFSALHLAALEGNSEMCRLLLEHGADPNIEGASGNRPLHMAASRCRFDVAEMLVGRGANVNTENESGVTAFMEACGQSCVSIASFLQKTHVDPFKSNASGSLTPLYYAAGSLKGSQGVKWLIELGADVNECVRNGEAALNVAMKYGDMKTIQTLVDAGGVVHGNDQQIIEVYAVARDRPDIDQEKIGRVIRRLQSEEDRN